jgi:hypothetical protein
VIPRASWQILKSRLGRRAAFTATSKDRAAIREAVDTARRGYSAAVQSGDVLPISTMQWSSVVMGHRGSHVAFIDIEQANAVAFLFCRMAWLEHPIFSFVEFMIRAAETFYDDGDVALAASIGERASDRLWEYCRHHDAGADVPRPMAIDDLLPAILDARLILSFITGHEIGHLMQVRGDAGGTALFDWIYERYNAINTTSGNWRSSASSNPR